MYSKLKKFSNELEVLKVIRKINNIKHYWKIFKIHFHRHDRTLRIKPSARGPWPDRVRVSRDDDVDLVHHCHLRHPQLTLGLPPPLPPFAGGPRFSPSAFQSGSAIHALKTH